MTVAVENEIQQMKKMIRDFVEQEVEPYAQQIEDEMPFHNI